MSIESRSPGLRHRYLARLGVLTVAFSLVAGTGAAPAGASGHRLKLKGTVVGQTTVAVGASTRNATVVLINQGSTKVGKLIVDDPSCAGQVCTAGGVAKLRVGTIKRKAKLSLIWRSSGEGCGLALPTCKQAKYGTGKITKGSRSEAIRLNTPYPNEPAGSRFGIVLSW